MSLAKLSIQRPIFITCVIIGIMFAGVLSFSGMSVDMYPETSIPVITVQTTYSGAGPEEIETLISRPIEDEVSSIAGIKTLSSKNLEGVSVVTVEFQTTVDAKYAEQQVRDKINIARPKLPDAVDDPVIKKFDLADMPILMVGLSAEGLAPDKIYDIADQYVKPRFEQVNNVGSIEIFGGRKREIHVLLDQAKLQRREISVSQVASQIGASGENVPSGKVNRQGQEIVYRGVGEFRTVDEIADTLVNLHGNEVPTRVSDLGKVKDTLEDEKNRGFFEGKPTVILQIYRQAGSNTLKVADDVKKQIAKVQIDLNNMANAPQLKVLVDSSTSIRHNVFDVYETIIIGIILTVITVLFFLGSMRSTLITALSLPVSLIGSFVLMSMAGFTINVISLLALTLAVGLLIDDAIVVIENIYRRMELGESAEEAAEKGTAEIQLAVIAITLVVMAVFVPVGMMSGMIGQFFKQFGLTVAFSMAISLFVALTIIPMLAAYFGGDGHSHGLKKGDVPTGLYDRTLGRLLRGFDRFQSWLENVYERFLRFTLRFPKSTLTATLLVFALSLYAATKIPSEFVPDADTGESSVTLELAPGSNLDATTKVFKQVEQIVKQNPEVDFVMGTVGGTFNESNKAMLFVKLHDKRDLTTVDFRDKLRKQLVALQEIANPIVKKYDTSGGAGQQPFILNLISQNSDELQKASGQALALLKADPRFKDVDTNFRTGKQEVQVRLKPGAAKEFGINTKTMGAELRAQIEGSTTAKFREHGREYDVRVRLQDNQRDLNQRFSEVYIPNINRKLVRLANVAEADLVAGPASIERRDRARFIQITANIAPGASLSEVVSHVQRSLTMGDSKLPNDVRFSLGGDAENMADMGTSAIIAILFGIICIYLILASLYESFITPMTIMVSFPLALSGAFYGLLLSGKSLNMFAMLGLFMLIGVAGKNGILLVDFTKQLMDEGVERLEALVRAGKTRLRPILMTSFALVAGTIPIAIGLNPASRARTSMGVVIIAGVIIATVLTLIAVPSLFVYVDRFRVWANSIGKKLVSKPKKPTDHATLTDRSRIENTIQ
ncbi:MAG: efflux RND transporter permease subunit [Bdellovibrionales bacterium]|nr:efflux RND transporter permease subunit [Bdellovibrionales bacterium]